MNFSILLRPSNPKSHMPTSPTCNKKINDKYKGNTNSERRVKTGDRKAARRNAMHFILVVCARQVRMVKR